MKKIALSFLLFATIGLAQAQQKISYYKNNGQMVSTKDSADLIQVIDLPSTGNRLFTLSTTYVDGTKSLIGKLSAIEPRMIYEDSLFCYSKKGELLSVTIYKKGEAQSEVSYFRNGKIESIENYRRTYDPVLITDLIYQADSLGNVLVKDGNGHISTVSDKNKGILKEEGNFKNGQKDGVWTGIGNYPDVKYEYKETYEKGELVRGVNIIDGKPFAYEQSFQPPSFTDRGIKDWYKYIGKTQTYPKAAYKNKIAGRVNTKFVVGKDGVLKDIVITNSVHPLLDNEAIRILKESPKWVAGRMRGIPVDVVYNQSFMFAL